MAHLYPLQTDTNNVGVGQSLEHLVFELSQNYPNPAIDKTSVSFKLHETAIVNLSVFNIYGQAAIGVRYILLSTASWQPNQNQADNGAVVITVEPVG